MNKTKGQIEKGLWIYTTKETQTRKNHKKIDRQFARKKYHNKFNNKCNLLDYQEITNQFDFESQLTKRKKLFSFSSSALHDFMHKICLVLV